MKSSRVFSNLPISNLSISDFKIAKSTFIVNFHVSTPVASFNPAFLHNKVNLQETFKFFPEGFGLGKYPLIYTMSFLSIQQLEKL